MDFPPLQACVHYTAFRFRRLDDQRDGAGTEEPVRYTAARTRACAGTGGNSTCANTRACANAGARWNDSGSRACRDSDTNTRAGRHAAGHRTGSRSYSGSGSRAEGRAAGRAAEAGRAGRSAPL